MASTWERRRVWSDSRWSRPHWGWRSQWGDPLCLQSILTGPQLSPLHHSLHLPNHVVPQHYLHIPLNLVVCCCVEVNVHRLQGCRINHGSWKKKEKNSFASIWAIIRTQIVKNWRKLEKFGVGHFVSDVFFCGWKHFIFCNFSRYWRPLMKSLLISRDEFSDIVEVMRQWLKTWYNYVEWKEKSLTYLRWHIFQGLL